MTDRIQDNPHIKHLDRAPYELGMLLCQLPGDFHVRGPRNTDEGQMASAAELHAENAMEELLHGLEGLGSLLFSGTANPDFPVDISVLPSIGNLLRHIAVEIQFLHDMQDSLAAGQRRGRPA